MSYSDVYEELYQEQWRKERIINETRERMKNELSTDDMIKIMFSNFVDTQPGVAVLRLGEQYLPKKEHAVKEEPEVQEICGATGLTCSKCSMGPCDSRKTVPIEK